MIYCCGTFRPEESWRLKNRYDNDIFYVKRRIEYGICPVCNKFVLRIWQTNIENGKEKTEIFKNRKALKAYEEAMKDKISEDYKSTKYGTRANMHWIYGINIEIKDKNKKIKEIRRYACDFNGTRNELITI